MNYWWITEFSKNFPELNDIPKQNTRKPSMNRVSNSAKILKSWFVTSKKCVRINHKSVTTVYCVNSIKYEFSVALRQMPMFSKWILSPAMRIIGAYERGVPQRLALAFISRKTFVSCRNVSYIYLLIALFSAICNTAVTLDHATIPVYWITREMYR